jgi:hypothetical protein
MKILCVTILAFLLLSCKKDNEPAINYCEEGIAEFKKNLIYDGTIFFCNAQPPQMAFIPGRATAIFIGSDTIQIQLRADSIGFDTILDYKINCSIAEEIFPVITLDGSTVNNQGYYTDLNRSIWFSFGYPNCLNNTGFDGICKQ